MAPIVVVNEKKLILLQKIRDEKEIIFGAFSKKLDKTMKIEKWKEIHNLAQSIGLVKGDKEWSYTRDVVWPNMRKGTMTKVDNSKRTGTAGGLKFKQNEVDAMILDIIGRDSEVVSGLGVSETWAPEVEVCSCSDAVEEPVTNGTLLNEPNVAQSNEQDHNATENTPSPSICYKGKMPKRKVKQGNQIPLCEDATEIAALKKRKLHLQIEYLELLNEKTRLELENLKSGHIQYIVNNVGQPSQMLVVEDDFSAVNE